MTLYSRRTFNKESFQWTKCVVKYLYDSYSHYSLSMLGFLVEVLEKGPPAVQPSILTIIHCMAHYVNLESATTSINSDLLRAVSKFVESVHWKEALKILKLAVTRSSTLVAPPSTVHSGLSYILRVEETLDESESCERVSGQPPQYNWSESWSTKVTIGHLQPELRVTGAT